MKHYIHLEELIDSIKITQDGIVMEIDTETLKDLVEMLQQEVVDE